MNHTPLHTSKWDFLFVRKLLRENKKISDNDDEVKRWINK
ncbi:hypothetical protein L479_02983 [Exiguobacterium sp. S17]|nr:hypothetical protein L479_02983 [Exiguobacterium sp. S17]